MEVHKNQVHEYFQSFMWLFILFIVDTKSTDSLTCYLDGVKYEVGDEIPSESSCETWCVGILGYLVCRSSLSYYQTVPQYVVIHHSCLIPPLEKANNYNIVLVIQIMVIFSTQCYSSSVPCHRIYNVELKKMDT